MNKNITVIGAGYVGLSLSTILAKDNNVTIFVDDNLRNIRAAEKLNIKGIHFKDPNKLVIELKNLKIIYQ